MHILTKEAGDIKGYIGLSGVFNIVHHYQFEQRRHMHEVSPMKAACLGEQNFERFSPSLLVGSLSQDNLDRIPPVLLVHGADDIVVPLSSSERLHQALVGAGLASHLHVLPGTDHMDFLLAAMMGRESEALAVMARFCAAELGTSDTLEYTKKKTAEAQLRAHL